MQMFVRLFFSLNSAFLIGLLFICALSCSNFNQKNDKKPNLNFFDNYLSSKTQYEMLKTNFPSLKDCKLVFSDQYSEIYYKWIEEIRNEYFNSGKPYNFLTDFGRIKYVFNVEEEELINSGAKIFKAVKFDSISTNEFKDNWKIYYQPSIKIFTIEFLREKADKEGFEFVGFVFINDQWKYFPKPSRKIFEKSAK